jgi:hypothetical protein
MTWAEFTVFMMIPVGALAIGYVAMRMPQRETERFDQRRLHPGE